MGAVCKCMPLHWQRRYSTIPQHTESQWKSCTSDLESAYYLHTQSINIINARSECSWCNSKQENKHRLRIEVVTRCFSGSLLKAIHQIILGFISTNSTDVGYSSGLRFLAFYSIIWSQVMVAWQRTSTASMLRCLTAELLFHSQKYQHVSVTLVEFRPGPAVNHTVYLFKQFRLFRHWLVGLSIPAKLAPLKWGARSMTFCNLSTELTLYFSLLQMRCTSRIFPCPTIVIRQTVKHVARQREEHFFSVDTFGSA